jgi:hypothetical protein
MKYHIEIRDMHGTGATRHRVYNMPIVEDGEYWPSVTEVPCPAGCGGVVLWAEAGYVPGYRICDRCDRHYLANGSREAPTLILD